MKIYVITNGVGVVLHAGTEEASVRKWAEDRQMNDHVTAVKWVEEWGGQERLHYRMASTGRWNKIPALFISSTELVKS